MTWVLDGELEHKDSEGNRGIIYPGLAQRMSAGTGIRHPEINPHQDIDVHFIQMWVPPDTEGIDPGYEQLDINRELQRGGLVPIASGRGHEAAIFIKQRGAVLWGGRLAPGQTVLVPEAPYVHLFIAKGEADLEGAGALGAGDAVRLTAAGARRLTADASAGVEVLIWETTQSLEASSEYAVSLCGNVVVALRCRLTPGRGHLQGSRWSHDRLGPHVEMRAAAQWSKI